MCEFIESKNAADCIVKKSTIVGNDDCRLRSVPNPRLKPRKSRKVEVIRWFIQEQSGPVGQEQRPRETRVFSPPLRFATRRSSGTVPMPRPEMTSSIW